MKTAVKFLLFSFWFFLANLDMEAQVTIGSLEEPVKGALLDLKEVTKADSTTATSGGLVLPRVKLVNRTTLQPFIKTDDTEWETQNRQQTRIEHIGMIVFDLTKTSFFQPGFYVWDGDEWEPLRWGGIIQLPAFKLEWLKGKKTTLDLFPIYEKNFKVNAATYVSSKKTKANLPNPATNADDFDYLLTGYNPLAFADVSIDATGKLTYTAIGQEEPLPEESYINVILVRKSK